MQFRNWVRELGAGAELEVVLPLEPHPATTTASATSSAANQMNLTSEPLAPWAP